MDFDAMYHFVFETYEGIGISIVVFLVVCVLLAVILERRTRKKISTCSRKSTTKRSSAPIKRYRKAVGAISLYCRIVGCNLKTPS